MPIKVTCPKCQGVLHAPDDAGGKKGKCPTCGTVLAIPAPGGPAPFGGGGMIPPEPDDVLAPTPFKAPSMTRSIPDEPRRSAFGNVPQSPLPPTGPDARPFRSSSQGFGAAPAVDGGRKPGEPFTKPARSAAQTSLGPLVRGWRSGRSGLWWCLLGYLLIFIGILAFTGLEIALMNGVKLPDASPGFLKVEELSQSAEIRFGALLIPVALGISALAVGRFGVGSVPQSSFARGLLKASAFCTFVALLGIIAAAVMTGSVIANGLPPTLILPDEPTGMIQRGGLAVAAVFSPLAELLFLVGLGQLGAGLQNARLSGRATRFLLLTAFAYVVAGLVSYGVAWYGSEIQKAINDQVTPKLNGLGDKQGLIGPVLALVAALLVYVLYIRLLGAGRSAIRDRLDSLT